MRLRDIWICCVPITSLTYLFHLSVRSLPKKPKIPNKVHRVYDNSLSFLWPFVYVCPKILIKNRIIVKKLKKKSIRRYGGRGIEGFACQANGRDAISRRKLQKICIFLEIMMHVHFFFVRIEMKVIRRKRFFWLKEKNIWLISSL